jgi:ATP-dependent RNA helicase DeaD
VTTPAPSASFADLGLRKKLLEALASLGYEEPTPIQAEAIPHLLAGRDLLGQAATGTGKTAAFALPMLSTLKSGRKGRSPVGLVLVPTRELCIQVSQALHRYGRDVGVRVLPIYGGQPIGRQLRELNDGVDMVVATPGRAVDHLRRGTLDLTGVTTVVLDEADEMLDMGFADDLEMILDATPATRQTVLFSATMPARLNRIARQHLTDPVRIQIERATAAEATPLVQQRAYVVARAHKAAALGRILDVESPSAAIVFCRTRAEVESLTESLNGRGYRCEALHGGMDQHQRDRVMGRVRAGTAELLVATDVAARGLDIDTLSHVFNYDVPSAPESYVHRIGRVGRAGREGVAITLAEPREHRLLKSIERVTKRRIPIETLPTTADLQARRIEMTRSALYETLVEDDLEHFRVVVDTLTDDFDVVQVALAAVKVAHEATNGAATGLEEIPIAQTPHDEPGPKTGGRADRGQRGAKKRPRPPGDGQRSRVYVSAGRKAGVRPQDLVGAIANETSLSGKDIGAIEITDNFSLVEIPDHSMAEVVKALGGTRIKGNRVKAKPDAGR